MINMKEKLRQEILGAMEYYKGGLYVGGMALCKIIRTFSGIHGKDSLQDLVKAADLSELKEAHALLEKWGFVQLGKERKRDLKRGVKFCPHCGERL